jgi:hypothetical protein
VRPKEAEPPGGKTPGMKELNRHDLVARLDRLEHTIRRDRAIALAVIGFAFATAQTAAPKAVQSAPIVISDASGASATLTATGLTFDDAHGNERTFVGLDSSGYPSLDLSDASGTLRESVYLLKDTPVLRQFDATEKDRMELRLDSTENAQMLFRDENGKARIGMFRTSTGDPQLALYGSDEKLRAYLATDDDSPYLVMRDATGATRLYAGGYTGGAIGMDIRDASSTVLWKAP